MKCTDCKYFFFNYNEDDFLVSEEQVEKLFYCKYKGELRPACKGTPIVLDEDMGEDRVCVFEKGE